MNSPQKLMFSQGIYQASSVRKELLGAMRIMDRGRVLRYCQNGAVALVPGKPTQSPAGIANHQNCANVGTTTAVGSTQVTITLGATAVTADQYAGGQLLVNAGTGLAHQYEIESHPAIALSASGIITLKEPLRAALAATDTKLTLVYNEYAVNVVSTGSTTNPTGLPNNNVPIGYYYWTQTRGITGGFVTNALGVNVGLILAAAIFVTATSADTERIIAHAYAKAGVTNEYVPVKLFID